MWPFSTIADLRQRLAAAEAALRERERREEALRHDYETLRAEYASVVQTLGNMATRPLAPRLFDLDLFREDPNQPTVYLTPAEDELGLNYDRLMDEATSAPTAE
jgi:hypothetical protein